MISVALATFRQQMRVWIPGLQAPVCVLFHYQLGMRLQPQHTSSAESAAVMASTVLRRPCFVVAGLLRGAWLGRTMKISRILSSPPARTPTLQNNLYSGVACYSALLL